MDKCFRVAVASILSPQGNATSYHALLSYLEDQLDEPVVMVQRRTYQETNDLLARNLVDMAFVCTGAFLEGYKKKEMELLAIPKINGAITYNALIIVAASSPIENLAELRGKTFAFTDPLSNTGYLYPLALFTERGTPPARFFGRTIFTYSHDRSIQSIITGVADGASVDNLVFAYAAHRDPSLAQHIRIIWKSKDFGMPPVVVPYGTSPAKKAKIQHILFTMAHTAKGRKILSKLGIEEFIPPQMNLYADDRGALP